MVIGGLSIVYPKPYSIYLRGTIGLWLPWLKDLQGRVQVEELGVGFRLSYTPKVCRIMAFWAIFRGFGLLFYLLSRSRLGLFLDGWSFMHPRSPVFGGFEVEGGHRLYASGGD